VGQIAGPLPGFNRNQSMYDVGLGAIWELDLFGGLRRGREAASAEADAAIAEQVGTRISVTADAADAYLRIRGDQARIAVAEQQVATDERLMPYSIVINNLGKLYLHLELVAAGNRIWPQRLEVVGEELWSLDLNLVAHIFECSFHVGEHFILPGAGRVSKAWAIPIYEESIRFQLGANVQPPGRVLIFEGAVGSSDSKAFRAYLQFLTLRSGIHCSCGNSSGSTLS
jgi:Outer membrane efflux protein